MEEKLSSLKDFEVQTKLGEGAFGQVFKVKRKQDGKEYALKKVPPLPRRSKSPP
jgi:serine/threonine protein kinase